MIIPPWYDGWYHYIDFWHSTGSKGKGGGYTICRLVVLLELGLPLILSLSCLYVMSLGGSCFLARYHGLLFSRKQIMNSYQIKRHADQ